MSVKEVVRLQAILAQAQAPLLTWHVKLVSKFHFIITHSRLGYYRRPGANFLARHACACVRLSVCPVN